MIVVYRALDRVRRTDRRPRLPVMAQALAVLLSRRPQEAPTRRELVPLLTRVWKRYSADMWSVADLRRDAWFSLTTRTGSAGSWRRPGGGDCLSVALSWCGSTRRIEPAGCGGWRGCEARKAACPRMRRRWGRRGS